MHRRPSPLRSPIWLLAFGTVSCSSPPCPKGSELRGNGLCYLIDSAPESDTTGEEDTASPEDTSTPGDTGTPTSDYTYGDPIEVLGTYGEGGGAGMPILYEWTDAAAIDDDYAIVTGQGGYGIISMADGNLIHQENIRRALRVATDGQNAILASRTDGLVRIDVSRGPDTRGSLDFRGPMLTTAHEDVDIQGDLVAVGWRSEGLYLLDLDGDVLSNVPAEDAFAVSFEGERVAYTDVAELVLMDISDPTSPVELDRQPMSGEGRDMSWKGEHLMVGLGGTGTGVWAVEDDQLVHRGDVRTPGSALSVAVDGDNGWIGAWEVTALVDLSANPPVVLGHEVPEDSAMGVGASGGRAVVADWFHSTALGANDGFAGPELLVASDLYFDPELASTQRLDVENHGPIALELTLDGADPGYSLSESTVTVPPGERTVLTVAWTDDSRPAPSDLRWTSNDPDEPSGIVRLQPADQGIGTEHEDFTVPGIQLPDTSERSWTLSEARGKVVVLVYWALF